MAAFKIKTRPMCFSSNEVDSKRVYSEGNRCFFFSFFPIYLFTCEYLFIHPCWTRTSFFFFFFSCSFLSRVFQDALVVLWGHYSEVGLIGAGGRAPFSQLNHMCSQLNICGQIWKLTSGMTFFLFYPLLK